MYPKYSWRRNLNIGTRRNEVDERAASECSSIAPRVIFNFIFCINTSYSHPHTFGRARGFIHGVRTPTHIYARLSTYTHAYVHAAPHDA